MAGNAFDLYQAIGGTAAWRKLAEVFYARVGRDPVLRPLFPGKTLHCAIEELTAFLVQFSGGPGADAQRRWWLSLRESHARFQIGTAERTAWMKNMVCALDEAGIEEPLRGALREFFERSSAYVVNQGQCPVAHRPESPTAALPSEIASRWDTQLALDEIASAIRAGEAERAITLALTPALRQQARWVWVGLLTLMMKSHNAELSRYVAQRVTEDPELLKEKFAGRTLLHDAAAQGELALVELFLRSGADPNAKDGGDHIPLYSVANECSTAEGSRVVHALVESGAEVNANGGVKRCTPLHMAARRGNCAIAAALLDRGAAIDPRDSQGETPLRRAVNCNKADVAALLLARGADPHSVGSKRLTPILAARTSEMRQILQLRGK